MKKALNQVLIVLMCVFVLLFVLFKTGTISSTFLYASFYSALINLANVVASLFAFNYSLEKGNKTFLLYNMGGMLLRILLLLAAILIFLKFLNIDKYGFIFTFSILYISFLVVEINYFRVRISQLKVSQKKV